MAAFGVLIGYSIAAGGIVFTQSLGIAMLVTFIICGAGMAINDVFDSKVDEKLKPEKPIPSGKISITKAMAYSVGLFVTGNLLALYYLPSQTTIIAAVFSLLLIAYASLLPKFKYLGNWVVAAGTAFTLVFGASLFGNYETVQFFALSALLANVAREIIKDVEDLEQDSGFKISLPMIMGEKIAKAMAISFVFVAIAASYIPALVFGFGGILFLIVLTIANAGFLRVVKTVLDGNIRTAQKHFKIAMLIALFSFLLGVIA